MAEDRDIIRGLSYRAEDVEFLLRNWPRLLEDRRMRLWLG